MIVNGKNETNPAHIGGFLGQTLKTLPDNRQKLSVSTVLPIILSGGNKKVAPIQ
jgi:hypothetical protein